MHDADALGDRMCPKCAVKMESIETSAEAAPLHQVRLCPSCYLVSWSYRDGFHTRQGVPMSKDRDPGLRSNPGWLAGKPDDC